MLVCLWVFVDTIIYRMLGIDFSFVATPPEWGQPKYKLGQAEIVVKALDATRLQSFEVAQKCTN